MSSQSGNASGASGSRRRSRRRSGSGRERRVHERLPFKVTRVMVAVQHPGGTSAKFLVACRDLSAGGLAFLHRGFLYIGTACEIHLPGTSGEVKLLAGQVARCEHCEGNIHEIGISFDSKIDPRWFLDVGVEYGEINSQPIELPELQGQILHVSADEMDVSLVQHYVQETGIKMVPCPDPWHAADIAQAEPIDLVICDLHLHNIDGKQVIGGMRASGYNGPILATSADSSEKCLASARSAGASETLVKPYSPASLLCALSALLDQASQSGSADPIYSTMAKKGGMGQLLEQFLTSVQTTSSQIEEAMKQNNLQDARLLCLKLQGSGSSSGYPLLTEVAGAAVDALSSDREASDAQSAVRRLLGICSRLRLAEAA